jgi:hypothetical protein
MSSRSLASSALAPVTGTLTPATGASRLPAVPWRDSHPVPPQKLAEVIASLKEACALNPANADLRVCLGIAHAMNYDVYSSLDVLEEARALEPRNFFAQFKFAELQYRLRALHIAEAETVQALELASNTSELAQARHQLSEIRGMTRESTVNPNWAKTLAIPVICLGLILAIVTVLFSVIR